VREAGYAVIPVPGANAAVAALSASGVSAPQFVFYGFLPAKAGERRKILGELAASRFTVVFYEAPHRVLESIADLAHVFGSARRVVIARELTKLFETIHECALGEAQAWLEENSNRTRGEFVLVVEGAGPDDAALMQRAQHTLATLLEELPLKQAASLAARITGARKNELYDLGLHLKKQAE
jgi:16S rRNA (cytidine1402-2'-O)-methyltransferase